MNADVENGAWLADVLTEASRHMRNPRCPRFVTDRIVLLVTDIMCGVGQIFAEELQMRKLSPEIRGDFVEERERNKNGIKTEAHKLRFLELMCQKLAAPNWKRSECCLLVFVWTCYLKIICRRIREIAAIGHH